MTKMTTCVSDSHICAPEIYEAFLKEQMFKIYLKPVWIRVSAVRLTYTKTDNHSSTKMAQKKNEQPPLRWVGSRECPGAEWGHLKRPPCCQLSNQTLGLFSVGGSCRDLNLVHSPGAHASHSPSSMSKHWFCLDRRACSKVDRPGHYSYTSLLPKRVLREASFLNNHYHKNFRPVSRAFCKIAVSPTKPSKPV